MNACRRWLALALLLAPGTAAVGDLGPLYGAQRLAGEGPRLERRVRELYSRGIEPELDEQERRALAGVTFEFPWAARDGNPLQFWSSRKDGRGAVALPILSLLFVEDLATAAAWLTSHGYSLETIDEYVTMWRYRPAEALPGGRLPPPLAALGIPADALAEPAVDELSLRLRNTAWAFILLHELGHLRYRHPGYQGVPTAQTRLNEAQADGFALEVLDRSSTIPIGAILYFQAQAYMQPHRGQYASDREWQEALATTLTHPLTADRLESIALDLDRAARAAGRGPEGETLAYISTRLVAIARILGDIDLRRCMAVVAHRADLSSLRPRRPGQTEAHLERWCGSGR